MKIALISPQGTFYSRSTAFSSFWSGSTDTNTNRRNWSGIGSALPTIAALTPEHDIQIIDENIEDIDFNAHYDLVGISAMTQQACRAYEICDAFKAKSVPTIMGGIHATLMPAESSQHATAVIVGEAEEIWATCLEDVSIKRIHNIYQGPMANLEKSPLPRYDLLVGKGYKILWLQTSRGCPYACEFCAASNVYGVGYRRKTVEQVVAEMTSVKSLFGDITIGLGDDNLAVNKKYLKELMSALKPMHIRFYMQADISIAEDEPLLEQLREVGCIQLFIGFESLTEEGLKTIDTSGRKLAHLPQYGQLVSRIQSHGIGVMGSFIVGLDSDTEESFDTVADFVLKNHMYAAQVAVLTPLPGTKLRERLMAEGRVPDLPWDRYTVGDLVFVHPTLTQESVEEGMLRAYKKINSIEHRLNVLYDFKRTYRKKA